MLERHLPYVVECDYGSGYYEPIAAFNVRSVAESYKQDCASHAHRLKYRVVRLEESQP